ncbi:MAG TPA: cupin domain-containing protein [Thermoanaerobaculia bacterium]
MVVELDGGCRVALLEDGKPRRRGNLRIWDRFRGEKVSMRVLELDGQATLRNKSVDEVLYMLRADIGIHVPAGATLPLEGSMTLIGVQTPRGPSELGGVQSVRLADVPIQRTGDRWYRELIQGETTLFVGSIPPGRAPDHFHLYEEVICILLGEGIMHAGASSTPIAAGSCIYLPRKQPHCLENTGSGELRLAGVFHPAGSPAVRYET